MSNYTFTPDPPVQGQSCKICKPGGGKFEFSWSPDDVTEPESATSAEGSNCVTVTIPDAATSIIVDDAEGRIIIPT